MPFKSASSILDWRKGLTVQSDAFDILFVLTAVVFNLLIVALFIVSKKMKLMLMGALGTAWLIPVIPLAVVFVSYALAGNDAAVLLAFGSVSLYMFVEWLLDCVFKIDFRSNWSRHIPYIVLEYIALFGLIGIAFSIDRVAGIVVSIPLWILMASLIYIYAGKKKQAA
jgi:hypothetical protein